VHGLGAAERIPGAAGIALAAPGVGSRDTAQPTGPGRPAPAAAHAGLAAARATRARVTATRAARARVPDGTAGRRTRIAAGITARGGVTSTCSDARMTARATGIAKVGAVAAGAAVCGGACRDEREHRNKVSRGSPVSSHGNAYQRTSTDHQQQAGCREVP